MKLKVKKLDPRADLPVYATPGSSAMDLAAWDVEGAFVIIASGERCLIPTGIAVEIPPGFEGQVRPRSGLAVKKGVTILNAPGTIDSDYRGEIMVPLINHGAAPVTINHGDRIAQLVIAPVERVEVEMVEELSETERGAGGFGSTGR